MPFLDSGRCTATSRRAFLHGAAGAIGLALGGCTAAETVFQRQAADDLPAAPDPSFTPASLRLGNGTIGVGLLAEDEIGNLSGGAPGSVYLAARLALHDLASDKVSLLIRNAGLRSGSFDTVARGLMADRPGAIVGPADEAATRRLVDLLAGKPVLVLSLARLGDPANRLYGAGVDYAAQAAVAAEEMGRRKYTDIVVATSDQHGSKAFGDALAVAAAAKGISVRSAHIPSPTDAAATVARAAQGGTAPSALVMAVSPELAQAALSGRATSSRLAALAVVGNAGWALAYLDPAQFEGAWYPTWPLESVKAFADKFALAYSATPTLDGIIAYDMTLLAAALPQIAGNDPYRREILAAPQGFTGQCGPFRFDPTTGLVSRTYTIATVG